MKLKMFFAVQMILSCMYDIVKLTFKQAVCMLLSCETLETHSISWLLTFKAKQKFPS